VPPSTYKRKIGEGASLSAAWHTYTIDWQPNHVAWYLDGQLLSRQNSDRSFIAPSKPMYFLASIWSDAARGFEFGGVLDYSKSPYYSSLANLMQIVCEGSLGYNGPNWLYDRSPAPEVEAVPEPAALDAEQPMSAEPAAAEPTAELPQEPPAAAPEPEPAAAEPAAAPEPTAAPLAPEPAPDAAPPGPEAGPVQPDAGVSGLFEADAPPPADAEGVASTEDAASANPADEQFVMDAGGPETTAGADSAAAGNPEAPTPLAPTPGHGAYLGCFNGAALGLNFGRGVQLARDTTATCADHCRGLKMPVYALNRAYECVCSAAIPEPSSKALDSACESVSESASGPALASAVAIYYLAAEPRAQSCEAARTKLSADNFKPMYNPNNAVYEGGPDSLALRMEGSDGVRVVAREPMRYGMFSFKGRVSDKSGVITAAYLRSDKHDWNDRAFEEIGECISGGGVAWG